MEVTYFQEPGKKFKEPFFYILYPIFVRECQITLTFEASIKLT